MHRIRIHLHVTRRQFLGRASTRHRRRGTRIAAESAASSPQADQRLPHFAPKAKRIIWLTQAGAPSQLDLFDHKPGLKAQFDKDLPDSVRGEPAAHRHDLGPDALSRSRRRSSSFTQHGQSGMWLSELLPHTAKLADEICLIRSLHTEAINHDPAMTLLQTGHQIAGRPSFGSWVTYGLGTENENLPAFVVLISRPSGRTNAQPLHERMWGSGFLPAKYQGVRFSSGKDPVLYLSNPPGITTDRRRAMLDDLGRAEPPEARRLSGSRNPDAHRPVRDGLPHADQRAGTRRSLARNPRQSSSATARNRASPAPTPRTACSPAGSPSAACASSSSTTAAGTSTTTCPAASRASATTPTSPPPRCSTELKQRGLLDDTLVVWGGEFGRTVYSQGTLTRDNYGRDHHPRCFSIWMAGGGVKARPRLRRDRRLQLQHRQGPRPHPRPQRHRAAPARHRPHTAHLPLPGPRLPPHRRPRPHRFEDPRVIFSSNDSSTRFMARRLSATGGVVKSRQTRGSKIHCNESGAGAFARMYEDIDPSTGLCGADESQYHDPGPHLWNDGGRDHRHQRDPRRRDRLFL